MLTKQVLTDRPQWRCQISGRLFDTRKEALDCATAICQQQLADGIPAARRSSGGGNSTKSPQSRKQLAGRRGLAGTHRAVFTKHLFGEIYVC